MWFDIWSGGDTSYKSNLFVMASTNESIVNIGYTCIYSLEFCKTIIRDLIGILFEQMFFYIKLMVMLKITECAKVEANQLHTVSEHCGYDLKQHHHALADAEACAAIALNMFQKTQTASFEELSAFVKQNYWKRFFLTA